jgi:hypothetical protein
MAAEKCEACGRFGARKYVEDRGPNGLGGRQTSTRWLCDSCEDRARREETAVRMANDYSRLTDDDEGGPNDPLSASYVKPTELGPRVPIPCRKMPR